MSKLVELFSNLSRLSSPTVCHPNKLILRDHDGAKIGAIVVIQQAGRGNDFALSAAGLEYVLTAQQEGRIAEAYVVLARRKIAYGQPRFEAYKNAREVHAQLRDIPPREGQWGDYWWIALTFLPVTDDPNAPF